MTMVEEAFVKDNKKYKLITLENKNGMEVKLLNYGAAIVDLLVPDRFGKLESVVLSYEDIEDYIVNPPYFGVTVGRISGRIANGVFGLDGKRYDLYKNYGVNHGHGGLRGFSFCPWDFEICEEDGAAKVEFTYFSGDMEEGYPGNMDVKVIYTLTDDNTLMIEYNAVSDKRTLCNLTNHAYFNLSGNYKRRVTEQHLRINAKSFLELNQNQIPTGRHIDVVDTPMDFNQSKLIGVDIEKDYQQLRLTNGYDHAWMLADKRNQIELYDKESGRKLTVSTTYPSVVVYSFNFPSQEKLKYGKAVSKYDGICLETQYEPDGINHTNLNSAVLDAGDRYYERTEYKFAIE